MLKKMYVIVTIIIMASMVLTACGGSPTLAPAPTQAPTQPPAESPTTPPTPKPTEPPAQPAAGKSTQQLTGTVWKWTTSLFNDDTRKTPDDPNKYLLEFLPQGQVSIKADCNRVSGTYTTEGNKLTITPGAGTLAACPPGSMGDEYIRQLTTVSSYLFNYGNLILEFKFDSGTMTFAPSAPVGLSGRAWKVVNYNNGNQAVVSLITGSEITLNFGADGQVERERRMQSVRWTLSGRRGFSQAGPACDNQDDVHCTRGRNGSGGQIPGGAPECGALQHRWGYADDP